MLKRKIGERNMRWINMSEKEMIKAWSNEEYADINIETYLSLTESNRESYWTKSDNDKNIVEYDFHSAPELLVLLKTALNDEFFEDLILPLTVAAFKEKAKLEHLHEDMDIENKEISEIVTDEFTIPEFVYVF